MMDPMTLAMWLTLVWLGIFGFIGNWIRMSAFNETFDIINFFLGPIGIIMSGIEAIIIKCQEHKLHKIRKEAQKPVDKYEKRAIERINMLLEINN